MRTGARAHVLIATALCLAGAITTLPARSAAPAERATQNAGDLTAELPRIPPTEPAASLATIRVQPGLRVDLVAAEPLVTDPVDIAWDENGNLYVCELWNYPGEPKAGEPLGRVRLLRSTRGDRTYDSATVFADSMKWPGGVACYDGGVFVVSSPDLWYLKDTDGDGKADLKEKLFTGFAGRTYEVANSLRWGPDNRIYVNGSYAGGTVSRVGPDGQPTGDAIRSRDFRFDPRTRVIEAVSGGGEWGQSFDDWGERFTCDATHMVWHPVLPRDELERNPNLAVSSVQQMSIPEWTTLFPISRPEPWKAARQKYWKRWVNTSRDMNAGRFPDTELAPHGFATSAGGITVYRGSALGEEFRGDAFVAEPANNVVVRLKLEPDGVGVRARRPQRDADEKREFLASTDNWFRPVNFANGPDGCLYVVAMYREIIEDESAIPDDILKNYDLYNGRERGRILRLAPQGFQPPPTPNLGRATTGQLVAKLDHPDSWPRETAQRLLVQRQDRSAVEPLRKLVEAAKRPQGRLHALWTLDGLGALDETTLSQALSDPHARAREHAVRLSAGLLERSAPLQQKVAALANDPDARVRFRVALRAPLLPHDPAVRSLVSIAEKDSGDPWSRTAILAGAVATAGDLFATLARRPAFLAQDGAGDLLAGLAGVVGTGRRKDDVTPLLDALQGETFAGRDDLRRSLLRALADGLARSGGSLAEYVSPGAPGQAVAALAPLFEDARKTALDRSAAESRRAAAVGLLGHAPFDLCGEPLAGLLNPAEPAAVQLAALRALAAHPDQRVGPALAARFRSLGPSLRQTALDALFRRPDRVAALLDALEKKDIAPSDIEPRRRQQLLDDRDPRTLARARALFGELAKTDKGAIVARYAREVEHLPGDAGRGQQVFRALCAACHNPDRGERLGPNLAALQDRSPATLLASILDPNREVKPAFVSYVIRTNDGQDFSGVVAAETASSITLRQAAGVEDVILRRNIRTMRSTGLSAMPDGLETGISLEQMADLLRFLQTLKAN